MLSAEDEFQGVGGVAFDLLDGVDVAVGRFELSVTAAELKNIINKIEAENYNGSQLCF